MVGGEDEDEWREGYIWVVLRVVRTGVAASLGPHVQFHTQEISSTEGLG